MSLSSNAKWNALSQFFKISIQLLNMVYLATIIPPSQYGLMAMAAVIINLGVLLRDLGTASAIIQRKELTEKLTSSIFWFNVFIGFILFLITIISSPLIASIYNQKELVLVLCLLSINFPLSSSASAHLALMERNSKFKKISFIEITSSSISVILAIIFAKLGYGVYSLVIQSISMSLFSSLLFWKYSNWTPSLWKRSMTSELRAIFGFSANLSIFNVINYFARNADSFIIGKFMSPTILGNYNLAYRIMLFPLASLTFVFGRSLYPIMSRNQDNLGYLRDIYLKCVFWVLCFSAPIMSGVALFSQPLIRNIFSNHWNLTSDILVWLAPTAILQSVISTTGAVFSSKGRTDILLKLGIIGTVLQVSAFLIGVNKDIIFFAQCYFVANVINFFPPVYMALKILGSNLFNFFSKILPIILSTIIMISFLKIITFKINYNDIDITNLLLFSLSGAIVYILSIVFFSKDVRSLIKKKSEG